MSGWKADPSWQWPGDYLKEEFLKWGVEVWSDDVCKLLREAGSSQEEVEKYLKPAREIKELAGEAASWKGAPNQPGWRYLGVTQTEFRNLVVRRDRYDEPTKTPAGNVYAHLRRQAVMVRQLNCLIISTPDFVKKLYKNGEVPPAVSRFLGVSLALHDVAERNIICLKRELHPRLPLSIVLPYCINCCIVG